MARTGTRESHSREIAKLQTRQSLTDENINSRQLPIALPVLPDADAGMPGGGSLNATPPIKEFANATPDGELL
jgi:hypothetical protein